MEKMRFFERPKEKDLEQFTKSFSKEERLRLASEIKLLREKYFSQKKSIQKDLDLSSENIENLKTNIEELYSELESVRARLSEIECSVYASLINMVGFSKETERLNSKSKNLEENLKQKEEKLFEYISGIETLKFALEDRTVLDEAREKIASFYKTQSEKFKIFVEEQEKNRSLKNLCEEYNVICIHSTHPYFVPDSNSLLDPLCDWQTKCDILLSFSPTIPASTISKGDNKDNMWAQIGFVIKDGFIESVNSGDAGTVANGFTERSGFDQLITKEKIRQSVLFRSKAYAQKYNELVISRSSISGFYISFDTVGDRKDSVPLHQEIFNYCSDIGLPVFGILSGQLYELEFDSEKKEYRLTDRLIKPDKVKSFSLTKEVLDRKRNNLLEDSPFRIHSPETHLVSSFSAGSQTYISINSENILKDKDDNYVLAELPGLSGKIKIFIKTIQGYRAIFKSIERKFAHNVKRSNYSEFICDMQLRESSSQYIDVTEFSTFDIGYYSGPEGYLQNMKNILEILVSENAYNFLKNKFSGSRINDEKLKSLKERYIELLSCHLYGFGEQAKKMNDGIIAEKAINLANQYLPRSKFLEILDRRVNEHMRIKLTEDDLKENIF